MEDITNYGFNNHKELSEQRFQLDVSFEELDAIVALAQNPHPSYQTVQQNMRIYEEIFYSGQKITKYIREKNQDTIELFEDKFGEEVNNNPRGVRRFTDSQGRTVEFDRDS